MITPSIPVSPTIAAIATAPGKGGVGIIRLSGKDALLIGEKICRQRLKPRHATLSGFYTYQNEQAFELLDEGIAIYFAGPHSFTGEDVIELQAHGGPVILDVIMQECLYLGAIHAQPGEFSERAFLNNKLDLTQAEAIADLINSASIQAARNAVKSLQGEFSKQINHLLQQVIHLRVFVESAIDFPEEEIDFISDSHVKSDLETLIITLDSIIANAEQGRIMQEGINIVIAGKPNAGKSSLLNVLAGHDAAIVTPVAGTTRDIIKEQITIDGMPLHITDTAGLRNSNDPVEQEGIRRAELAINNADVILLITDDSQQEKEITHSQWPPLIQNKTNVTVIYNKIDITRKKPLITNNKKPTSIWLSAQTGSGIDLLKTHLKSKAGLQQQEGTFSARRRHLDALIRAKDAVIRGQHQLISVGATELLADDLRQCQQYLGEITGTFSADDLLGEIFSSFCIGK